MPKHKTGRRTRKSRCPPKPKQLDTTSAVEHNCICHSISLFVFEYGLRQHKQKEPKQMHPGCQTHLGGFTILCVQPRCASRRVLCKAQGNSIQVSQRKPDGHGWVKRNGSGRWGQYSQSNCLHPIIQSVKVTVVGEDSIAQGPVLIPKWIR